jgi:membrane protein YqaA with SNARE-associated domain
LPVAAFLMPISIHFAVMNATQSVARLVRRAHAISFIWGMVESMLFFLVPDVFLSVVAIHSLRRSLWSCIWAVAGAMVGGLLMYVWGVQDHVTALRVVDAVPAIPADMLVKVHQELSDKGLVAMLSGPLVGIPYKIYAVQAGALGLPWPRFLLMTIPARIVRFLITCVVFNFLAGHIRRYGGPKAVAGCWLLFWVLNYTFYWHANMRP